MNEKQEICAGCGKDFSKADLVEEERTRNGKPVGTFFWCGDCLEKELVNWKKQSGKRELRITLKDD